MKTGSLTIRRFPTRVRKALKRSAEANGKTMDQEALSWLEEKSDEGTALTCGELARNLRKAQKLLNRKEREEFAEAIQAGRIAMSHEHLR